MSHLTHAGNPAKSAANGSRRPRRSSPRHRRDPTPRPGGQRRGHPPRPSTGASPCRRDPAGRRMGPRTRSSGGSARTCRRRRGSGTHNGARLVVYAPRLRGAGALSCLATAGVSAGESERAPSAPASESPAVGEGPSPFGLMVLALGTDWCLVVVVELLAAQQRDQRAADRHDRGGGEDDDQAVVERRRDQVREELPAGEHRDVMRGQPGQHAGRGQQVLHRVVAEQRGEHRADRRQVADMRGYRGRHALGGQPAR